MYTFSSTVNNIGMSDGRCPHIRRLEGTLLPRSQQLHRRSVRDDMTLQT